MSESNGESPSIKKRVLELPGDAWRWLADSWMMSDVYVRNTWRTLRRASVDYVLMPVGGPLPERAGPRRGFLSRRLPLWPEPPLSMEYLNGRLRLIGDADNVKGVLFIFRGFETGLATIQNFRRSLERLREAGKESIVFTPYLDLRHYYAASAADRIYAPPAASFSMLGLYAESLFLKEALAQIGVSVDVVQISPYKTAYDSLQHADFTPEHRAQLEWLLDDQYAQITGDIARSRGMEQAVFAGLIDGAPYSAEQAAALGLIDGLAFEDELAALLAAEEPAADGAAAQDGAEDTAENGQGDPAQAKTAEIKSWPAAYPLLLEKPRRRARRFVGVVSIEGLLTMGSSRRSPIDLPIPFLGDSTAGEQTVAALLRRVERLEDMAALVLHVDSAGGMALAADFMGREIERINRKLPVVAYMGNVAASGGYYISAPTRHIMSQTGTMTGSIGVILLRASTRDLYEKLHINRIALQRGAHANLYSDSAPMNSEERQIFTTEIVHSYEQFKEIVSRGRDIPLADLDPLCEGRVWTGSQAQALGLVDSHGDFVDAIRTAAALGGLPVEDGTAIPVANLYTKEDSYILPRPYEEAQAALSRLLSTEWLQALNGRPLWVMPVNLRIR